jgi:hypothetical protein
MAVVIVSIPKPLSLRRYFKRNRQMLLVLLAFMLIPSMAIFCLQWSSPISSGKAGRLLSSEKPILAASSQLTGSWLNDFLRDSPLAPLSGMALPDSNNVFRNLSKHEMISADGDPFLYAYLNGESEGVLVPKGQTSGIQTLGIPGVNGASAPSASLDALQLLQAEVGGSFAAFRSKLFGASSNGSDQEGSGTLQVENPFSKALSALSEDKGATTPSKDKPEIKSGTEPEDTTGNSESGSVSGTASRPYLMLKVDDSGNLHTMPASQPHSGTFETAELGTRDYAILPFGDTADFMGNIAVADFNGDGISDVAYFTPFQESLRFFYGSADGTFSEQLNIDAGRVPRSIATGDFNGDGQVDIALSSNGGGLVAILFGNGPYSYRYKSYYFPNYWDYTVAADTRGSGIPDLVGINYSENAFVLISSDQANGSDFGRVFSYTPALNSFISTSKGQSIDLNAVVLSSSLSLNVDNRLSQLTNVLNVSAGSNVYVVVGDLFGDGRTIIGIAIPHP